MSEQDQKKDYMQNIYQFFGLDDFESDRDLINAAFGRIEDAYGIKLDMNTKPDAAAEPPAKLKSMLPNWDAESFRKFIEDLWRVANVYKLTLDEPRKTKYDEDLLEREDLHQKPESAAAGQFTTDGLNESQAEYYARLKQEGYNTPYPEDSDADKDWRVAVMSKFLNDCHGYLMDENNIPQLENDVDFEAEEALDVEDDLEDADFGDEAPARTPQSKVNQSFSGASRDTMVYPQNGREDEEKLKQSMPLKNSHADWGNINLHVMTSVEGQRHLWNRKSGFSIGGRLDVEGEVVQQPGKPMQRVAVFGKVNIQCNGGFLDGNIDGRVRETKYKQGVQQGPDGKPVQVEYPVHSYSKGKVIIDAGDEDLVINGNVLGNVEIRTTGKVKVLGHIDGKVSINAAQGIDVLGDVSGRASLTAAGGTIEISGKKGILTSTTGTANVRGADITDNMLYKARTAAHHKNFASKDTADVDVEDADFTDSPKKSAQSQAPHA